MIGICFGVLNYNNLYKKYLQTMKTAHTTQHTYMRTDICPRTSKNKATSKHPLSPKDKCR